MTEAPAPAPDWFRTAIDTPCADRSITVEGCAIRYLLWDGDGDRHPDRPGLVLVHGNGAHAHWWSFIAPFFLDHYRVAALHLSGMGDSAHRDSYSPETFAAEVVAVADDAGFGSDSIVVGHSFGGFVTLKTGLLNPDRFAGVVLVDSPVRPPDYKWERDPRRAPIRPKSVSPTFADAVARFRLMPPQDCANQYVVDYIAKHSVQEVPGGWTWKFDGELFSKFIFQEMHDQLARLRCRVGVIYGEQSVLVDQEIVDFMYDTLDASVPFVAIPEAQHHLFLDQPLAFVSALRAVLAEWRHSRPLRQI